MRFVKRYKNVFMPLDAKTLSEVEIVPGDTVLSYTDDGEPYGVCGAVYATQVDLNRQLELKEIVHGREQS